jgi:Tfp pilus assembly protein PilV
MRSPPRRRPGLTTVEVLVALVLFAAAILAQLSAQTALVRLTGIARASRQLAAAGAGVIDSLRLMPCAHRASGTRSLPAGSLRWTTSSSSGVTHIHLMATPVRSAPWQAETVAPC